MGATILLSCPFLNGLFVYMKTKTIVLAPILFFFTTLAAKPALAKIICEPIYGGGERCREVGKIWIDKEVQKRGASEFYDDLGAADSFYANDIITFRIKIKNVADETIGNIEVRDKIPDYTEFFSGPGSYDIDKREIYFEVKDLPVGEIKEDKISVKVVGENDLPADTTCPSNSVKAHTEEGDYTDNAYFCVRQRILGITPPTGANLIAYAVLFLSSGISGLVLKRKAKSYNY